MPRRAAQEPPPEPTTEPAPEPVTEPAGSGGGPLVGFATAALERALVHASLDADETQVARAEAAFASARDELDRALADDVALAVVAAQAGLDADQTELLAVLLAVEDNEALQRLVVSLSADRDRHRVELWMLPFLLPGATPALVGPSSALVRSALVTTASRGAFGRTALVVAPRLLWALWGDPEPDPRLPAGTELVRAPGGTPPLDDVDALLVAGPDPTRRRERVLDALPDHLVLLAPQPTTEEQWAGLVLEATLGGAAVVVEVDRPLDAAGRRWVEAARHLRWALSSTRPVPLAELPGRAWRDLEPADPHVTATEWEARAAEADGTPDLPPTLTADQLRRMQRARELTGGDTDAAYRRLTDARINELATRIVPRAGWDDLVLAPARKQRLRDLVDRYRGASTVYGAWGLRPTPSRGLVALFSGRSGTGKTMSAEVVAGELGLDMYRLDLSGVVSKYIGETEKNLDELFDAASIGGTVLFFDEADAMFGKRTEVTDAHDRYANVGTSYLLQRLERYDGIVVMATNYEKNIDEAFLRRVHVRLDFPLPGEAERAELWRRNLVPGMPTAGDIDVAWLVDKLPVSGAAIRNIVVDAAFLAARDDAAVGMEHLVRGAARELHKTSTRITRDVFGPWFDVAVQASTG